MWSLGLLITGVWIIGKAKDAPETMTHGVVWLGFIVIAAAAFVSWSTSRD